MTNESYSQSLNLVHSHEHTKVGPGARLRKAREALNYRIEDVANQLNLRQALIFAIENDDYSKAPNRVFIRGYLRAYAKLVNLPVEEILEQYDHVGHEDAPVEVYNEQIYQSESINLEKYSSWILAAFVLITLMLVYFWWHSERRTWQNNNSAKHAQMSVSANKPETIVNQVSSDNTDSITTPINLSPDQATTNSNTDQKNVADANSLAKDSGLITGKNNQVSLDSADKNASKQSSQDSNASKVKQKNNTKHIEITPPFGN